MSNQDFLFELGTEELPPGALLSLSDALGKSLTAQLNDAQLNFSSLELFAAPRRLAVLVKELDSQQPDRNIEKRGPSAKAPEQAAKGFAGSCGVSLEDLVIENTDKGDYYVYRGTEVGKPAAELLPGMLETALSGLPIPKRMRWAASRTEFVRPVKWIVALLGDEVLPCTLLEVTSGRKSRGHRFHYPHDIELMTAGEYAATLRNTGKVVASFAERREMIREQVLAEAARIGGTADIDEDLLDEVCALNEWPVALAGRFEERFLEVPEQVLILSMKENQKYFHLVDSNNKLMPYFITISNIESKDPQQVIAGNEKVIRPRLADAAFFFETDKKAPLIDRLEKLKSVVFQNELGTVADKAARIEATATAIAKLIGGNEAFAARASQLAKCDLLTDTVYEFTELQGLMGYHFALHDGEEQEVAQAIYEQYMPKFAGDDLPASKTGIAVALADRLDTLVGLFAINQPPTGSKDPFALRRAALGVLRIIVEHELDLDLKELLQTAASNYQALPALDSAADNVFEFMLERFRFWFEEEGISAEIYLSIHGLRPSKPLDFVRRAHAVAAFTQLEAASALIAGNKRVGNILAKLDSTPSTAINDALLSDEAEKELAQALKGLSSSVASMTGEGDYQGALQALADLRQPIDRFFEEVRVMADDADVKQNRLAMLQQLKELFGGIADISELAG
ncbi:MULTISPECIES: glycine--tRNA ligase subunit beta [unclassified Marinobacterium]|jgi:glycyl-tRNA synthetase beta chain|uniref:glycine--tRNA ligase subunit beta n=1 Tax=unclassified Marinobacterium TaxID=2644139 RepID=UPI00156A547B|nr:MULTISPECIES: glycine--tRNA ligase subunit beta [unclassified Marinobacterium]NRP11127.1 Glycine--tRNA ligase beta subunit [Marinobacterium sp. xm-g-48]NRP38706.1 Glycine--tRNA ligase beta subunit [Marinobacterium sp. xm-a-121]NRP52299.1 Glycine--tRNA ligase beta subunit [Marinobacterium sp. xm-v-242]NRP58329.1 Glycine--tRNA ligase beta subunit [Marinobacterium sp. xm-d-510]NRP76880.1 Glycine--tRNA ligase beta subunit [Marinobacterium sp. xm-m-383]